MNVQEVRQAIAARVEEVFRIMEQKKDRQFERPTIAYDLTGARAGTATYDSRLLRFNLRLAIENQQAFLDDTPGHEAAHLISYDLFGQRGAGHGSLWRSVMAQIGQKPKRCHSFEVKHNRIKYVCACPERVHYLSTRMHNSILNGQLYNCRFCRRHLYEESKKASIERGLARLVQNRSQTTSSAFYSIV